MPGNAVELRSWCRNRLTQSAIMENGNGAHHTQWADTSPVTPSRSLLRGTASSAAVRQCSTAQRENKRESSATDAKLLKITKNEFIVAAPNRGRRDNDWTD